MSSRDDIDFTRSRAILLGTSEYTAGFEDRRPMPAALHSLTAMRKVLTGPCEWPKSRITELANECDSGQLLRTITGLISDVEDVLLFYYVGHGLPLPENGRYDLGLALTDTVDRPAQQALTSLRLRDLRDVLAQSSNARIKMLVLDCCCSGIATKYGGPVSNLTAFADSATPARGAGTYVWAACGHTQETYFEDGKKGLTYFTKFLSEAVRDAHDEHTPGATVAHLHDEVRRRLRTESIPNATVQPLPDLHYSGRPDQFLFVRGRAPLPPGRPFAFAPLEPGDPRRIGPYDIKARLGAGGIGRVFLAFTPTRQAIAVKLLRSELSQDPEFARRFNREIKVARRMRSSHVARVLDADPDATEPWLASSYVCGPTLLELVRDNGPLPTRDVLLITAGIARALEAVQAAGAVHRDLKPANVVLDETGPKVIDFGIAKSVATSLMTRANVQLGTPAYKSPEQALGREVTPASDIFTLGSTVYFLATGRDPFEAEDPLGLINLIAREEPDLDALDDEVRGVVTRCMAKEPADRPTPTQVVEMCALFTGPDATRAYPYIANAGPAMNARAAALRALSPPPPLRVPTPAPVPAASPAAPPPDADPGNAAPARERTFTLTQVRSALGTAALALCVLAAIFLPKALHSHNSASDHETGSPVSVTTTEAAPASSDPDDDEETTPPDDSPSDTPSDDPTTDPAETPSDDDPVRDAAAGECLANHGNYSDPLMEASDCVNGSFVVLKVVHGTSDTDRCSDMANVDYSVGYPDDDLVLCLTYRSSSRIYHSRAGTCVFGPDSTAGSWYEQSCQTGNFRVNARLVGTTDKSRCEAYPPDEQHVTTTTAWDELDVVLCLSMNYPDDIARAPVNKCLLRTGPSQGQGHFEAVDCSQANVVVTGRTPRYNDPSFCTPGHGWTSWHSPTFPRYAYTVCFRTM